MTPITSEKKITGEISGSVTRRNRCHPLRALDVRGFVELARHVEHAREEDDHRVADPPEASSTSVGFDHWAS